MDATLGTMADGRPIHRIHLTSDQLRVVLTDFGARMLAIKAPDRDRRFDHVLLGFDRLDMILRAGSFGAVLGRTANRIARGRFTLDGTTYSLSQNDGENTLHGGKDGFSERLWSIASRSNASISFALHSHDGDQGFPGAVDATATYTVEGPALRLDLAATTSAPTPLNLSAHPYFNLGGAASPNVEDHLLQVFASRFLPTDAQQIPTGEMRPVDGTPFDFREPVAIGARIRGDDTQLLFARGIDHHLIVTGSEGVLRPAARLSHRPTGRLLEVTTDRSGLQVYTGNSLDGSLVGHRGTYRQTAGLALESQAYPDSPNHPGFPSTILRPGGRFHATTIYRFTATA